MKTAAKFTLTALLGLAFSAWYFWPKATKLPNHQIDRLMMADDIARLFSDSANFVIVKELDSIRYSESSQTINRLYTVFQKISLDDVQFNYSSSYQKFENIDDAKSLQSSNRLLGEIPGMQKSMIAGISTCDDFEIYRSKSEINIFGRCDALIYTIAVRSDSVSNLHINNAAFSLLMGGKISSIVMNKRN